MSSQENHSPSGTVNEEIQVQTYLLYQIVGIDDNEDAPTPLVDADSAKGLITPLTSNMRPED